MQVQIELSVDSLMAPHFAAVVAKPIADGSVVPSFLVSFSEFHGDC